MMKTNKNWIILVSAILVMLSGFACNSDDDAAEVTYDDPELIGVWKFDSVTFESKDSVLVDKDSLTLDRVYLTIETGGTLNAGSLYNGTYKIKDQKGRVEFKISRIDFSGVPTPNWIVILMNSLNNAAFYDIQGSNLRVKNDSQTAHFKKIQK